ncbi:MAG: patatin-like phospholipase family protein [Bacteroidota bacterium]
MEKKYKVGLALSGGVFRGVAHVGVIKALQEHGIAADAVIGTSAGAIAGALYASGKTPEEMMEFVQQWAWIKAVRPSFRIDGLTSLAFLKEHLLKYVGHDHFEELKIPFYAGVTNMNDGVLEAMNVGSLSDVVMASCSIPLVFKPVEIEGKVYVDGGIMSNLAIEPLRTECDILIGVNVMSQGTVDSKYLQNVLGIAQRLFYLGIVANSKENLDKCDIAIEPEVGNYSVFKIFTKDFTNIYEAGYEATMRQMPRIIELIEARKSIEAWKSAALERKRELS